MLTIVKGHVSQCKGVAAQWYFLILFVFDLAEKEISSTAFHE